MDNVLVVEDDAATAAFLADNLIADGFEVATASGVAEAVRAIEVRGPALVILDLMLEDGNGLVLLDRVRGADVAGGARMDPQLPNPGVTGRARDLGRLDGFRRGGKP